jgi:DNA-binding transcriptional MerR regulator
MRDEGRKNARAVRQPFVGRRRSLFPSRSCGENASPPRWRSFRSPGIDVRVDSKVYACHVTLTVSKLAMKVGVTADTIRYYEKAGLLSPPERNRSGYRLYDERTVDRLRFIRGVQRFGLRLREVRELLEIMDRGLCPCGHTDALVRRRMNEIDDQIAKLTEAKDRLRVLAEEVQSVRAQDAKTGRWPCQRQFLEISADAERR